jgi:Domain of unknown function (DUF4203)
MLPASYAAYAVATLVVGGLIACFAGYRLFRLVLGLFGFYAGALMASQLMDLSSHNWALLLAALVGGLLGAGLMLAAYFIGVGLVGAGLAALGLNVAWRFIVGGEPPTTVLVIVCVLGALGALSVVRYVVIFGTALAGSWTLLVGALAMRGDGTAQRAASAGDVWMLYPLDPLSARWWLLPAWLVIALFGVIVQLMTSASAKSSGGGRRRRGKKKQQHNNKEE